MPYGPQQADPPPLPGEVTAVRVLMALGGLLGVLIGLGVIAVALFVVEMEPGAPASAAEWLEFAAMFSEVTGIPAEYLVAGAGAIVGVPLVTGLISLALAALAGRRSRLWLWSVVGFQVLLALAYAANLLVLNLLAVLPLSLCILKIGLMCSGRARAYYRS
ncbi:hypothetical protein GCM10027440_18730 [Nocardiopsis coralliicola]